MQLMQSMDFDDDGQSKNQNGPRNCTLNIVQGSDYFNPIDQLQAAGLRTRLEASMGSDYKIKELMKPPSKQNFAELNLMHR